MVWTEPNLRAAMASPEAEVSSLHPGPERGGSCRSTVWSEQRVVCEVWGKKPSLCNRKLRGEAAHSPEDLAERITEGATLTNRFSKQPSVGRVGI